MNTQTVFHGTGWYAESNIRLVGPEMKHRSYHQKRKSFSTSTDFAVAELFAIRRTSQNAYLQGGIDGVVLEFSLSGTVGKDFDPVRDPSCTQDEKEIAVYNRKRLRLVAVWRYDGDWKREEEPSAT